MTRRVLSDWLVAYARFTEGTEPPTSYHAWCGVSVIAGALQRKCYLRWPPEIIYPNFYIVLVGPTGKCRKGTAMRLARDIVKDAALPVVAESITREQLIRRMSKAVNNFTDATTGAIRFHCSLHCMSPELSVFLGKEEVRFMADLTDWYDGADEWKYETKHQGYDHIQGVCFNLLGATAPDWFTTMLPKAAIGGGFTARIIFVVEFEKKCTVPQYVETEEIKKIRQGLVEDLAKISNLTGEFTFSPDAKSIYMDWYRQSDELTKDGKPAILEPRLSGYCERRATHLRKLCMIISAARGDSRVIESVDIERARVMLETTEVNMPRAFSQIGASQYVAATETVLAILTMRKKMTRSELLQLIYRDVDLPTLEIVERSLENMRLISIVRSFGKDGEVHYEYIGPS